MTSGDDTREQGVEFGALADELESEEYPQEKAAIIEKYGGHEIDLEEGTQTLQEILGPTGETTYESADGVMQGVIGNVGTGAIGRENYTDRGGGPPGEEQDDEESF